MSQLRFLFDEDVSHHIIAYLRSAEPTMDILVVGAVGAPPKGTFDPEVYRAAVALGRTLVSSDRKTMTQAVYEDLAAGGHNGGTIFLKRRQSVARCAGDLHLIWYCDTTDDWIDRTDYLPY
jgi:hypothetical protein